MLAGVYFPVEILPPALRLIAYLLPLSHALEGLRFALMRGDNIFVLSRYVVILLIFNAILIPISLFSIRYVDRSSEADGGVLVITNMIDEARLITSSLRVADSAWDADAASRADWVRLADHADAHSLTPILYSTWADRIPESIRDHFARAYRDNAIRNTHNQKRID